MAVSLQNGINLQVRTRCDGDVSIPILVAFHHDLNAVGAAVEVASSAKTEVGRDQANRQADLLLIKLRRMVNGDGNGDAEESAFASIVNYQIVSDRCEILRQAVSQEFFACLKQQAAAHDKAMKSIGLAN